MGIAKKCIGCQSNKKRRGVNYYTCHIYIGSFGNHKRHTIFRNKFCPCIECLVKATCTDPKVVSVESLDRDLIHKCELFKKQIVDFRSSIRKYGI